MKMFLQQSTRCLMILAVSLSATVTAKAETLSVAVASNFSHTLRLLSEDFTKQTGHRLRISSASTGKLYTQIHHGAPFDIFMSADESRPDLLVSKKMADPASAYVYAKGEIVLMSNIFVGDLCQDVLSSGDLKRLSIANPRTAPYGVASKQVMEKLGLWHQLQPRLVKGENIAQTLQFVSTKNAEAGFVAKSMLKMGKEIEYACIWNVPVDMYEPINQKMVVLNKAKDNAAVKSFVQYMQSEPAKRMIKSAGYSVM